ncbi:MAG: ABC transporter ATP-binding protein [Gammaproteobacteria bacterium]|nr:ABC transporter ATP-binding protein [Gammaproteobacteria bacterium]MDX5374935.1 ABC transporter ATP-binding protein [Gammaproteobacteria bacterium]
MFQAIDLKTALFGPVSFAVAAGECLVLRGPSGAGKSQLLRALADLDPSEGEVWLEGVERRAMPVTAWRRAVGLLPAEAAWWHETVGAHFPEPAAVDVAALGFRAGVMDWEVTRLSSGERQRLALLRVLANRPRVLLLDEPTANLDDDNAARVEALVRAYLQEHGACALWVSHDPAEVQRMADQVLVLDARGEGQAA